MSRRALLSPRSLLVMGILLLGLAAVYVWVAPSNKYILLPDRAHPVAPLVQVQGARPARGTGGIYFVDVVVRKATLLERLFRGLRNGSTLVPASAINQGVSTSTRRQLDQLDMTRSQQVAAAVALRSLGYRVREKPIGVVVAAVFDGTPAAKALDAGDIITAVDGRPVRSAAALRRLIGRHKPGEKVRLTVRSDGGTKSVEVKTVRDPRSGRTVIGVYASVAADISLPKKVKIDVGNVVGPSAGLAFALALREKLGADVDHGHRVAVTGALELNGHVDPIGGVKQKTIGAREAHVDAFVVPAGDNAREARRYAHGLRIIPVESFRQALRALATLPSKE